MTRRKRFQVLVKSTPQAMPFLQQLYPSWKHWRWYYTDTKRQMAIRQLNKNHSNLGLVFKAGDP